MDLLTNELVSVRVMALSVALLVTGAWLVTTAIVTTRARAMVWRLVPLCITLMLVLHGTGVMTGAGAWLQQAWQRPAARASTSVAASQATQPDEFSWRARVSAMHVETQLLLLPNHEEERYEVSPERERIRSGSPRRNDSETPAESDTVRADAVADASDSTSFRAAWWAWLWIAGTGVCWLVGAWGSLRYRWLIHRSLRLVRDTAVLERLRSVQQRFGMRGEVRIFEHPRLVSPIAYGMWRPTIVLPEQFADRFDRQQQEAVFAHELAHLIACDTGWRQLSDFVCSLLWWHPLVWFAQVRLRDSMELAADEASLRIPEGPDHLAACLIRVGRQLIGPTPGVVAVSGPRRSTLGRRVRRLMELSERNASPSPRSWSLATLFFVFLVFSISALVPAALLGADSYSQRGGNPMQMLRNSWRQSLVGVAVAAWMTPVLLADGTDDAVSSSDVEVDVEVVADVSTGDADEGVDETEDGHRVIVREYRVRGGNGPRVTAGSDLGDASVVEQRVIRHRARLADGEHRRSEVDSPRSVERRFSVKSPRDRSALIHSAIENLRAAGLNELADQASKRLTQDEPASRRGILATTSRFRSTGSEPVRSEPVRSNVDNLQRQLEVMRRQMQSMQRTLNQLMEQRRPKEHVAY